MGGRSWRGGVGEAEEAVAEIDVGCSGGEGVEAAEAGLGDACFADDGHVLGGAVLADADAAGDEVDGEGLAFAQFAEDGSAAGIAEDAAETGEGNGGGGGIFHGVVMVEAEVAFGVEVKRIGVAAVASGRQENVGVEVEVARGEVEVARGGAEVAVGKAEIVVGEAEDAVGDAEDAVGKAEDALGGVRFS